MEQMELVNWAMDAKLEPCRKTLMKENQDKTRIGYADRGKHCKTRGEPEYYCRNRLYLEKSKKTFIHENLQTDDNTDSSGKTGNGKSILELDELDEVNQMAKMTKSWNHKEYSWDEQQNQGGWQMTEIVESRKDIKEVKRR